MSKIKKSERKKKYSSFSLIILGLLLGGILLQQSISGIDTKSYAVSNEHLYLSPSVIRQVDNANGLNNSQDRKPASVILKMSGDNVVGADNSVLGAFREVYSSTIKNKSIAVLNVNDMETANKVVKTIGELGLQDIAIMSKSEEILKAVKQKNNKIRTVIEFDAKLDNYADYVFSANRAGAQTIILAEYDFEVVDFIQARFKTVWVKPASDAKSISSAISSSAYGLIAVDEQKIFSVLDKYEKFGTVRMPYFVAHRGLSSTFNENSLDGAKEAVKGGATHIELDIHLSKDKKLVVMHDASITRTTNGEGDIADMTLAEIQAYKINNKGYESPIPTLEDFYKEFANTNIVIVIELKSTQEDLVSELKTLTEKYKMQSQITAISFHRSQLLRMKDDFPIIPTSYLCSAEGGEKLLPTLLELNSGFDSIITGFDSRNREFFADRGYSIWLWTFNEDFLMQAMEGVVGLTTNCADSAAFLVRKIVTKETYKMPKNWKIADGITVSAVSFDKTQKDVVASVIIIDGKMKNKEGATAVLCVENELSGVLYSEPVTIFSSSGCGK